MSTAAPAAAAPPVLEVRGVRRRFPGGTGLDGVDLDLHAGEILALLGPNGAGKTSLIRAVCGRLRLEGGRVALEGRDPRLERAARTRLGLVPQRIALYEELTVRENLAVLGRLAGLAPADVPESIQRGLAWAGLAERAGDRARTLSGGMQRRLNLVAGVLHRPAVLLLDEPSVGVDPDARLRLHALLESLRDEGMALLLTTHDLDEAAALSDRIGLLVDGRLRALGSLDELLAQAFDGAQHLEVLLGAAPDDAQAGALRAWGLQPGQDAARWMGTREPGLGQLGTLESSLREAGLVPRTVQLVQPGLRELFLRLTGREWVA